MVITCFETPNLVGEMFVVAGKGRAPLLAIAGGLTGGRLAVVGGPIYSDSVFIEHGDPATSDAVSENAALIAPASTDYEPAQSLNYIQIVQRSVEVSYMKESVNAFIEADADTYMVDSSQPRSVEDWKALQVRMNLETLAARFEWAGINQVAVKPGAKATVAKTGGLLDTGYLTSNVVNASGKTLKEAVNELMREMDANGAPLSNPLLICKGFQKQAISAAFGYAPMDRNVGGVNVKVIETDFAPLPVLNVPNVAIAEIYVVDMSVFRPAVLPHRKGFLFYEDLPQTGAGVRGQIYGQLGWLRGPESFHGRIYNLPTA